MLNTIKNKLKLLDHGLTAQANNFSFTFQGGFFAIKDFSFPNM